MSGVILPIRCVVASLIWIILIVVPRGLYYFGLRAEALDALLAPWATFIILLAVGCLYILPWLKNIKLVVFALLGILAVAAILTFFICELSLPW